MFKLSSLTRPSSMKIVASNNFINALSNDLKSAKEQIKENEENADARYNQIFFQAMEAIKRFTSSPGFDEKSFDEAANSLVESTKLKSGKAEPYFYLAWLFHFVGNTEKALKYLKVALFIKPDLKGIDLLKEEISSAHNMQKQRPVFNENRVVPVNSSVSLNLKSVPRISSVIRK